MEPGRCYLFRVMATIGSAETGWSVEITLATQVLKEVLYRCFTRFGARALVPVLGVGAWALLPAPGDGHGRRK